MALKSKDERRQHILTAAREISEETGLLDVGLRAIARRSGQTTGAIYNLFDGKDDIFAALLERSLEALFERVSSAATSHPDDANAALRAAAEAFFAHYCENDFEQKLGLYQFSNGTQTGLGKDADRRLNAKLRLTVGVFEDCFLRNGEDQTSAKAKSDALFSALIGVSTMATLRRDRSIGTSAHTILDTTISIFAYK